MRERNFNVRVTEDELAKLAALAKDRDVPMTTLVRHWVRDLYAQRFGATPPAPIEDKR